MVDHCIRPEFETGFFLDDTISPLRLPKDRWEEIQARLRRIIEEKFFQDLGLTSAPTEP